MNFEKWFPKKIPKEKQKIDQRILPFDVRYALQYKEGMLDSREIEDLLNNHFINEATYLTSKVLVSDPEKHKEFLEKYANCILNKNNLINKKEVLKELIIQVLKNNDNVSVKGGKIAQLSRQGFDFWQEKYKLLSAEMSKENREVFLLAHSTFVGLDSFLKAFSEKHKDLNILIPEWENDENFGYRISFSEDKINVQYLQGLIEDKTGSILIDDTQNTGNTIGKAKSKLQERGLTKIETRVIDRAH